MTTARGRCRSRGRTERAHRSLENRTERGFPQRPHASSSIRFTHEIPDSPRDRGYLETFMDWNLIYRDEYEMALLGASLDPIRVESYDVYGDPAGSVVYLLVKRIG